ncbi:MAG: cation-translocating P-type ATPase [Bacteroidales bacterium]|nr:cation-translocating P-type ATPase [Bacteroidales bacterium]
MKASGKIFVELVVEGMHCHNCALGIKKQLENIGFTDVDVNFASGDVTFFSETNEKVILAVSKINSLGYKVVSAPENIESAKHSWFDIKKKFYFCLIFTVPLLISMFIPIHFFHNPYTHLFLTLPVFVVGAYHFGKSAYNSIKTGIPNMDVLIILGSGAAFIYSLTGLILNLGENYLFFETSASIITLILLGNLLEYESVKKTTSSINELVNLQKIIAKRIIIFKETQNENIEEIDAKKIRKSDLLLINNGDKIPVDGSIYWGDGYIDESMLTGESSPVFKKINDNVIGGTILNSGSIKIRATAVGNQTVLSQIINLVKNAQHDKPAMQNLADKISAVFIPVVIGISLITFTIHFFFNVVGFQESLLRSIAVLVIACPCALGLAIPTAVIVGVGRVAKNGILIKGGSVIQNFANITKIVFDKTGTLTTGNFRIKKIEYYDKSEDTVKSIIAGIEKYSTHPIAKSITVELKNTEPYHFEKVNEIKGIGLSAESADGKKYQIGSYQLVKDLTTDFSHNIYLIENNKIIATIDIEDEIKPEAKQTIEILKSKGIESVLLSGDKKEKCLELANKVGIQKVYYEKLVSEKYQIIEELSKENKVAMVGDGINDAPALAKATVGVSLSNATQVAIQSAQIILLNGDLSLLLKTLSISKNTMATIKQNLFWAFFYNIIAIPIAAAGFLSPMLAAGAMAFSDVFVVLNSLRLRRKRID